MIIDELKYKILQQFGFPPTQEQAHALEVFAEFLTDRDPHAVMILRGSAGTGKTTLSGAIVRTLKEIRQKVMLLAPTGRAAKVFSLNSGSPAYTIHRRIYREKSFSGVEGQFNLNDNLYTDTLFMVDEASMIANMGLGGMSFGSGCLLDDLVHFVYQGRNDRLLLIGDKAQLPPVGEEESPALHAAMLEGYGLKVYECDLNEVLRQSEESGILYNATMIRQMITHDDITQLPKIHFAGYSDIKPMPGAELIEALADSYHHVGLDDTIVVTRSNKRANIFNQGIRNMVLDREEELSQGDILMIVKNNYYWMEEERKKILKSGVKTEASGADAANHTVQSSKFQVQSNQVQSNHTVQSSKFKVQSNKSAEQISQKVFRMMIGLAVLVFGLFYLIGYDLPFDENPDFNAPLFTDVLIFLMWLFLIGGVGLAVYSMVKDYRSSKSEAVVNGVPVRRIFRITWLTLLAVLVLTFLLGGSDPMLINGENYADWLWLKLSDMFVITSLLMLLAGIGAVCFGATRYIRKKQ